MKISAIAVMFLTIVLSGCEKVVVDDPPAPESPSSDKKWIVTTIAGGTAGDFKDGPVSDSRFNARRCRGCS